MSKTYSIKRWQRLAGILKEDHRDGNGPGIGEEEWVVTSYQNGQFHSASEPIYSLEEAEEMLKKMRIAEPDKQFELDKKEESASDPSNFGGFSSDFE